MENFYTNLKINMRIDFWLLNLSIVLKLHGMLFYRKSLERKFVVKILLLRFFLILHCLFLLAWSEI